MRLFARIAAVLLVAPAAAVAQHPLLMLPLDDPAYLQLQVLDRGGCVPARISAYRPFLVRDVRRALLAAMRDPACPSPVLRVLVRRFGADTVQRDSIATALLQPAVASDTGRLTFTYYPVTGDSIDAGGAAGFGAGGEATVRITGLSNGDFRPLWQDVLPPAQGEPPVVGIARVRVRYSASPRFLAVGEVYAQSEMRDDPTVRAKSLRHTGAFMAPGQSYLNARLGPITLSFGRSDEAWLGQGRESLVLGAHGPMLDRLMVNGTWRRVQGRAFYGVLSDVVLTPAQDSLAPAFGEQRFHRAVVGHALSWEPVPQVELTAGETMLFSRHGAPLDLAYANPMMPYLVAQNDTARTGTEARDNLMVFGAARARLGTAIISGELLVDDIQIDPHDPARAQNQLGYALRASVPIPAGLPLVAAGSYTRLDSYTYTRPWYSEVYQNYGRPLGSELGPDADRLDLGLELWPAPVLRLAAGGGWWRRGANRIDLRPSAGPNFHRGEPFPSTRPDRPAVQSAMTGRVSARVLTPLLPVTAQLDLARISDVNNVPGAAALYLRLRLEGSYAFQYP